MFENKEKIFIYSVMKKTNHEASKYLTSHKRPLFPFFKKSFKKHDETYNSAISMTESIMNKIEKDLKNYGIDISSLNDYYPEI